MWIIRFERAISLNRTSDSLVDTVAVLTCSGCKKEKRVQGIYSFTKKEMYLFGGYGSMAESLVGKVKSGVPRCTCQDARCSIGKGYQRKGHEMFRGRNAAT